MDFSLKETECLQHTHTTLLRALPTTEDYTFLQKHHS